MWSDFPCVARIWEFGDGPCPELGSAVRRRRPDWGAAQSVSDLFTFTAVQHGRPGPGSAASENLLEGQ
jgi:hypothetical protein